MYLEGNGTPKDMARAYVWITLAGEVPEFSSDLDPQLLRSKKSEVERQLSREQLEEAKTIRATMVAKNLTPATVPPVNEKPANSQPVQSASGVRLNLPAGWEQRPLTERMASTGVIVFAVNRTTDTGAVLTSVKRQGITDLMTYATTRRAAQANNLTDVQQSSVSPVQVSGKNGMRFEVTGALKTGQKLSYLMTIIEGDTDIVILNTWTTAAGLDLQRAAMGQLAENISGY